MPVDRVDHDCKGWEPIYFDDLRMGLQHERSVLEGERDQNRICPSLIQVLVIRLRPRDRADLTVSAQIRCLVISPSRWDKFGIHVP